MEIEKELNENEIIVSSTDTRGIINYANREFSEMSEYKKSELYGQPHNLIRHPDMPKVVFKYLWDNLKNKKTVLAYVKNYTKDKKKYYWVKAVIYPIVKNGEIVQYTSYRTKPTRYAINQINEIYKVLTDYERSNSVEKSLEYFTKYLSDRLLTYGTFINKLNEDKQILNDKLLQVDITQFKVDHILFRSNIESQVNRGEENIEVTKPTCCAFGKQLALLEKETFASDNRFTRIKQIHNRIHQEMQTYVDSSASQREIVIDDVHRDINELFETMYDLVAHYN